MKRYSHMILIGLFVSMLTLFPVSSYAQEENSQRKPRRNAGDKRERKSAERKSAQNRGGSAKEYGYVHGDVLSSPGYLRVTVSENGARVEYVRASLPKDERENRTNREVAYSYTVDAGDQNPLR